MNRKKILRKIGLLLFILLVVNIANAQIKLSGHVVDQTTHENLEGVNVYIPDLKIGVVSNSKGLFSINIPSQRKLSIQFSYVGYKTILKHLDISSSLAPLEISLEPVSVKSEEVVVSGVSTSTQHDNAIKIEILHARELETSGSPNLIQSLTTIPGVNMISKSPGVSMPMIRGMSMTNIIVMNNGVKLENYQYSMNHAFIIDEFGVDRIEVIKGPASLLYGSGAVGGVINFIKEKPAMQDGIEGDYTGHYHTGTQGVCNSLGFKGKKNNICYGVRAGYKNHADYLDGNGDYVPNTRFTDHSFKANIGLLKPYGNFHLYYDYNRPQLGMCLKQAIPFIKERGRKLEWWYQDLNAHILSSRNKIFLGDYRFDINLAFQSNHRIGRTDTTTAGYKLVDATLNTFLYEVKTHIPSGQHTEYIIGIQGENKTNRNHDAPVDIIPNADHTNLSLFGIVQSKFWKILKVQTGIRYDYSYLSTTSRDKLDKINRDFNNISSSLGASCQITPNLVFRLNMASAYRIPNMAELTQNGWHGPRYEQGNADLKAQQNLEADLSLHYHSNKLIMDVSTFYNHVDNYIYLAPSDDLTPSGAQIYRHTQCNAYLQGYEMTCAYAPAKQIKLQATYAYLNAKRNDGSYLPLIAPGHLSLSAKLKKDKVGFLHDTFLKLGLDMEGEQNKPSEFETATDAYCLLNMGCGAKIKNKNNPIEIGLFVNNLFNKTYYNHLSTIKDLGYYNMGRNVSFLLKVPFGN